MSSARITAAARALCRQASIECNVGEADNWKTYSEMFIEDARVAIEAADAIPLPVVGPPKPRKKHEMIRKHLAMQASVIEQLQEHKSALEETVRAYREKYVVIGQAATPENICK